MKLLLSEQEDGDETEKDDSKAEKESADGADDSITVTNMSGRKPGIDHFKNEESNPVKSGAMSEYSS